MKALQNTYSARIASAVAREKRCHSQSNRESLISSHPLTQLIGVKDGIKLPNGLLLDGLNALLVADLGTGKLFRVEYVKQGNKAKSRVTALNQGFGKFDGLVRDSNGALYTRDWAGGNVWKLSDPRATQQLISTGHQSSADISLSTDGKKIWMPDMKAGTLVPISIR